jgi:hypothetical protein
VGRELLDWRLQSLSRTTNFATRKFRVEMSFTSATPPHAQKNRVRRVLLPISFKTSQYRRFWPLVACVIA